jgi:hypothetical protein
MVSKSIGLNMAFLAETMKSNVLTIATLQTILVLGIAFLNYSFNQKMKSKAQGAIAASKK